MQQPVLSFIIFFIVKHRRTKTNPNKPLKPLAVPQVTTGSPESKALKKKYEASRK